jgi:hypothetical protein
MTTTEQEPTIQQRIDERPGAGPGKLRGLGRRILPRRARAPPTQSHDLTLGADGRGLRG